jgi:hypothetical protein
MASLTLKIFKHKSTLSQVLKHGSFLLGKVSKSCTINI